MFQFTLCADDYGLSDSVSAGIREALAQSRLTATSAITTRSGWPQAARVLVPLAALTDVGLHLNLTLGEPLGAMPSLASGGRLPPIGDIVRRARRGTLPAAEIRREIDRQLDAFEAGLGRPPDFVDGHQHVHGLPGIRESLLDALDARGWRGRLWLRDSADAVPRLLRRRASVLKALAVAWLSRGFGAAAAARGYVTNDGFAGFSGFDPGLDLDVAFARYLAAPGPRHLVMCHPGHVDAELARLDPVTASREAELAYLLSERFAERLLRSHAALVRLSRAIPAFTEG